MAGEVWATVRKLRRITVVRVLFQGQRSLVHFRRGYRYARSLPSASSAPERSGPTTSLEEYFDRHTAGPGLWKWRHYFEIYERHLARFRGSPVRIVEIGVFGGGSLRMWRDYFGSDCQIYGVDINPASVAHQTDNVVIFIGDQASPDFWQYVLGEVPEIDIVLDDGGHQAHQQIVTFEALLPHIAPAGIYLCEDVHGPMHAFHAYIDGLTRPLSDIPSPDGQLPANSLHQHVASVHRYPLVTVIEKPAHLVTHFEAPRHGNEWPA